MTFVERPSPKRRKNRFLGLVQIASKPEEMLMLDPSARWRIDARRHLLDFLREAEAEVVPFGVEHFKAAAGDDFAKTGLEPPSPG
jgi:hypothetical protein